jgi:hypothetical protein
MEDNQRMEDDLTHVLINIVRDNQKLRDRIDKGDSRDIIDKYTSLVQYHVATYVDNDIKGINPSAQRSGRPMKTLKSRLGAKTGRVRGNLMGKRVDFSARSVITPDPNIELDELGVPEEIAHAAEAHHEDIEATTVEALVVRVVDAISAARPGARNISAENFGERMRDLENTALGFEGVEKAYAISAGREVRVFVKPQELDDLSAIKLARDVATKIESSMQYPGTIKVNVIRETRAIEFAK